MAEDGRGDDGRLGAPSVVALATGGMVGGEDLLRPWLLRHTLTAQAR